MRFLTGNRIVLLITGLLVVLALTGWFLFGSGLLKPTAPVSDSVPGSTIDTECQAVYQKIMTQGFRSMILEAESGFKVEKALYISGKEAKDKYKSVPNIQDNSYVCYVQIRGNIEVSSHLTRTVQIYKTAFAFYTPDSLLPLLIGSNDKN